MASNEARKTDLDAWLRRTSIGLRSVLNAWSRRVAGMSFARLAEINPRLAATIAYQVLGDHIGGFIANLVLEHYRSKDTDTAEEDSREKLGGGVNSRGSIFSFTPL